MTRFACFDELMTCLRNERKKGERFATRFILVYGRNAWEDLVPKLTREVGEVVCLSNFCSGPDVLPDMRRVLTYLKASKEQLVLLVPMAECLRLTSSFGDTIRALAEWPASVGGMQRLYVPLLAAEEFLLGELKKVHRFQDDLLPSILGLAGEGSVEITIAPFLAKGVEPLVIEGIRDYLRRWETGGLRTAWMVSELAPHLSRQYAASDFTLRIYPSSFEYVRRLFANDQLSESWGTRENWDWLTREICEGESLDQAAGRILNVGGYRAEQLFALWHKLDENRQWLVWLWSKLRAKPGTYLREALTASHGLVDFGHNAAMTGFSSPRSQAFSRERKELLQCLGVNPMPQEFWSRYEELTEPVDQLALLTDFSEAERQELVRCVGRLLSSYPRELWWEHLEVAFPKLAWYLQPASTGDEFADAYFRIYNGCRVRDSADQELTVQVDRWAEGQLLWYYRTRSDSLAEQRAQGSPVLWVDAMGAEWTGLLTHLLAHSGDVECEVRAVRANLPSVTEVNKEWDAGEDVMRGLDEIAHHYDYRFPQSYLKAVEVIEAVAHRVLGLLAQHQTVVITADHGLSRFAATSDAKVKAPNGAKVEPRGRYAAVEDHGSHSSGIWTAEGGAVYLLTHHRFIGGGHSRGEVHGGASPEECVVPVVVARKSAAEGPLKLVLLTQNVKLNARGGGVLRVRFDRNPRSVELRMGGRSFPGEPTSGLEWKFPLADLRTGDYVGKLYSSARPVGEVAFQAERGMVEDDLGLGGRDRA